MACHRQRCLAGSIVSWAGSRVASFGFRVKRSLRREPSPAACRRREF